ncbi:unnamed protein product [Laminaria digitata]
MSISPSLARGGLSSRLSASSSSASRKVFCDMDGVLVDFDKGCVAVMGTTPDQLSKKNMWRGLANARSFYEHLDWMSDGQDLWNNIVDLHPTILTGLPMGKWAEPQKRKWCVRELGEDVPVITCMSRDKHLHCIPGSVLIDDRLSLQADWQRAGGVFIHHTSATTSLEELKTLLDPPPVPSDGNPSKKARLHDHREA